MSERAHLLSLPNEMLWRILRKLNIGSLYKVSRTSTRLEAIVGSFTLGTSSLVASEVNLPSAFLNRHLDHTSSSLWMSDCTLNDGNVASLAVDCNLRPSNVYLRGVGFGGGLSMSQLIEQTSLLSLAACTVLDSDTYETTMHSFWENSFTRGSGTLTLCKINSETNDAVVVMIDKFTEAALAHLADANGLSGLFEIKNEISGQASSFTYSWEANADLRSNTINNFYSHVTDLFLERDQGYPFHTSYLLEMLTILLFNKI